MKIPFWKRDIKKFSEDGIYSTGNIRDEQKNHKYSAETSKMGPAGVIRVFTVSFCEIRSSSGVCRILWYLYALIKLKKLLLSPGTYPVQYRCL